MRLIDADALEKYITDIIPQETFSPYGKGVLDILTHLKNRIRTEMPSVDAEPVRHGRWITKDSKTAKCSCCGWWQHARMYYLPDDIQEFSKCYLFCTACGTKMDGGADNG